MKHLFIISMILTSLSSFAQENKAVDEKYGFRDYKFGTLVSGFQDLALDKDAGDLKTYSKNNAEKLTIGEYKLKTIDYTFYKGKFFSASLLAVGLANCHGIRDVLEAQFGKGTKDASGVISWEGNRAKVTYEESTRTNDAHIVFLSKEISKQISDDKKKKAGSDL